MADLFKIPSGGPGSLVPNVWWKTGNLLSVKCPDCGGVGILSHEVNSEGVVSPSLVCPYDGCSFHRFVKLEGWVA